MKPRRAARASPETPTQPGGHPVVSGRAVAGERSVSIVRRGAAGPNASPSGVIGALLTRANRGAHRRPRDHVTMVVKEPGVDEHNRQRRIDERLRRYA